MAAALFLARHCFSLGIFDVKLIILHILANLSCQCQVYHTVIILAKSSKRMSKRSNQMLNHGQHKQAMESAIDPRIKLARNMAWLRQKTRVSSLSEFLPNILMMKNNPIKLHHHIIRFRSNIRNLPNILMKNSPVKLHHHIQIRKQ